MAAHSLEAPEVVVRGMHFASMGASERRDLGVCDEVAARGSCGGEQLHDMSHVVFAR